MSLGWVSLQVLEDMSNRRENIIPLFGMDRMRLNILDMGQDRPQISRDSIT